MKQWLVFLETNIKICRCVKDYIPFHTPINSNIQRPPIFLNIITVILELAKYTMLDYEQHVVLLTNICFLKILSTAPHAVAVQLKMHLTFSLFVISIPI